MKITVERVALVLAVLLMTSWGAAAAREFQFRALRAHAEALADTVAIERAALTRVTAAQETLRDAQLRELRDSIARIPTFVPSTAPVRLVELLDTLTVAPPELVALVDSVVAENRDMAVHIAGLEEHIAGEPERLEARDRLWVAQMGAANELIAAQGRQVEALEAALDARPPAPRWGLAVFAGVDVTGKPAIGVGVSYRIKIPFIG